MVRAFQQRLILIPMLGLLTCSLVAPVELWHHHDDCESTVPGRNHCALCHHQSLPLMASDYVPLLSSEPTLVVAELHPVVLLDLADIETHSIRGPPL